VGPAGLRLQEVAALARVSHPTILHYFRSRAALVRAVAERALDALQVELIASFREEGQDIDAIALFDKTFRLLNERGHARLWVWLVLSGQLPSSGQTWVRDVAKIAHAKRRTEPGKPPPTFEDTLFRTMLAGLALFGEAIIGDAMRTSAGLGRNRKTATRFRAWLALFLSESLGEPTR